MQQVDVQRSQEFRKCIECFLCQNICHVIRDHPENERPFAGPRFLMRIAELEMHPADTADRREIAQDDFGLGYCNITKCCTEVCPENIKITDNALIPMKERVVGRKYDPLVWLGSKITRRPRDAHDTPGRPRPRANPAITGTAGADHADRLAASRARDVSAGCRPTRVPGQARPLGRNPTPVASAATFARHARPPR